MNFNYTYKMTNSHVTTNHIFIPMECTVPEVKEKVFDKVEVYYDSNEVDAVINYIWTQSPFIGEGSPASDFSVFRDYGSFRNAILSHLENFGREAIVDCRDYHNYCNTSSWCGILFDADVWENGATVSLFVSLFTEEAGELSKFSLNLPFVNAV